MLGVIFANGNLHHPELVRATIRPDDLIIAADGGGNHLIKAGLIPEVIIGDCDSISPTVLDTLVKAGANLLRYPIDKDQTDLELALDYAINQGCQEIHIYGALGTRWDQSLANLLLMGIKRLTGIPVHWATTSAMSLSSTSSSSWCSASQASNFSLNSPSRRKRRAFFSAARS